MLMILYFLTGIQLFEPLGPVERRRHVPLPEVQPRKVLLESVSGTEPRSSVRRLR